MAQILQGQMAEQMPQPMQGGVPVKTGEVLRMRESYGEDVANYIGPESCVGFPRGGGEALTGVRGAQVLGREIMITANGVEPS